MQISDYKFHLFKGPGVESVPGIFIYIHQATGKCFIRAMRNSRMQRGKNNYPTLLKELLKTNPSEVLIYVADLPNNTKEALFQASCVIRNDLSSKGLLYVQPKLKHAGCHCGCDGKTEGFTVWKLTHKLTGAVYYFEEIQGSGVLNKVSHRMLSFNNCVVKNIAGTNRVMYNFARRFFPLDISHWDIEDLCLRLLDEQDALAHITTLSKKHLENKEAVLNRISGADPLYYRNNVMKMKHVGIDEYLK